VLAVTVEQAESQRVMDLLAERIRSSWETSGLKAA
jgi:hypothetical protein